MTTRTTEAIEMMEGNPEHCIGSSLGKRSWDGGNAVSFVLERGEFLFWRTLFQHEEQFSGCPVLWPFWDIGPPDRDDTRPECGDRYRLQVPATVYRYRYLLKIHQTVYLLSKVSQ